MRPPEKRRKSLRQRVFGWARKLAGKNVPAKNENMPRVRGGTAGGLKSRHGEA